MAERSRTAYAGSMRRLINYFLQGLIFLVPIVFTLWAVGSAFLAIDRWTGRLITAPVCGVGFAVMLVGVTVFGFLASNFLTRRLLQFFEQQLDRLPLLRLLHTSIKDLMS